MLPATLNWLKKENKILAAARATPQPPSSQTYGINLKLLGHFLLKLLQDFKKT